MNFYFRGNHQVAVADQIVVIHQIAVDNQEKMRFSC
jgi:hypothetical protein